MDRTFNKPLIENLLAEVKKAFPLAEVYHFNDYHELHDCLNIKYKDPLGGEVYIFLRFHKGFGRPYFCDICLESLDFCYFLEEDVVEISEERLNKFLSESEAALSNYFKDL